MSGKSPWSVKGVSAEDREVAKTAARKAGVPIGVWLSEQIRQASEETPPPAPPAPDSPRRPDNDDHWQTQASGQQSHPPQDRHPQDNSSQDRRRSGQVDPRFAFGRGQWSVAEEVVDTGMVGTASAGYPWQFRNAQHPPAVVAAPPAPASGGYPPPMPQPQQMPAAVPQQTGLSREEAEAMEKHVEAIEGRLRSLQQRVDDVEDKTLARFEPVLAKIEALTAELERIDAKPAMIAQGEASFSTAPIERAVMRLSERLGRVEQSVLPGSKRGRGFFSRLFRRG
ncbi:hypothetical protein [Nisaea sp.]|uniref:hypothetical protein n=1 Tax=Nisaea sp. TaxID=2024842 RepID=UPI0032EA9E19